MALIILGIILLIGSVASGQIATSPVLILVGLILLGTVVVCAVNMVGRRGGG